MRRILIGSRKSDLARIQAQAVGAELSRFFPALKVEFEFRESLGDKNLQDPLWKMPEKGVFTEDFVGGLLDGRLDFVVHSWKDLPIEDHPQLALMGALDRADPRDLFLLKKAHLPKVKQSGKLRVFSSSPRREFCLEKSLRDLLPMKVETIETRSVRGNIPTRLRKLMENPEINGLLLAKAALDRILGTTTEEYASVRSSIHSILEECAWMVLPLSLFPTAPAQGALAVQYRKDRKEIAEVLQTIRKIEVESCVNQERLRLKSLGGGCHQKLGCTVISGNPKVEFFVSEQPLAREAEEKTTVQWSSRSWAPFRKRSSVSFDLARLKRARGILVSKSEAWPEGFTAESAQLIWTAGVQTWKKLAQVGVWVHGTADRFGLRQPQIQWTPLQESEVVYLTHQDAVKSAQDVATYMLDWKQTPPLPPENAQKLFLSSVGDLDMLLKIRGTREGDLWVTGLGETYQAALARLPSTVAHQGSWESF